jgi:competence CoiA-like predicted nuclease
MLLNHRHLTVANGDDANSFCPDCESPLIAKRGTIITWHWAHKTLANAQFGCHGGETDWHLKMKEYVLQWPDWDVELPVVVEGKKFRLDAFNKSTKQVIEFVHTMSPHYEEKHHLLQKSGLNVVWILDGDEFVSKRHSTSLCGYYAFVFLNPKPDEFDQKISNVIILFGGVFWSKGGRDWWGNDFIGPVELKRTRQGDPFYSWHRVIMSDEITDRLVQQINS